MFLAQSTVSRTIQNLETELGCTLFERTTHGVSLTEEGRILYHHLKLAFEHITAAEERLDNIRNLNEGLLRIGASELTLEYYLIPYLEKFKREYPKIRIQVSYSNPTHAISYLNSKLLDVAVLAGPFIEDDSIKTIPLNRGEVDYVLIAGNGFSELQSKTVDLHDLRDYPFISMEKGMGARIFADQIAEKHGFILRPESEVGSMPLLISLVQINLGLAFIPEPHSKLPLSENSVFKVDLFQELPKENISLLTCKDTPRNRALIRFIDILSETI
jgi:DNA-binding transcriptional LysR family regulator